ncbi:hypothetical protein HHK36_018398 [Tetracentron sinense]|uniref:RING-type domain-containing protein n=1 Tax=Tetracentron sinense TaxID=13715 RepID=A0A835DB89_TETSI|nr:hypothetical protein HHK36_018398 [Tetracentron sinense]
MNNLLPSHSKRSGAVPSVAPTILPNKGEEDPNSFTVPRLIIILIGFSSAAIVVAIYHCFAVGWCNRRQPLSDPPWRPHEQETPSSIENSIVQLIPSCKYHQEMGFIGEDRTCAVCLSEFEEGEELRTLPDCMHSFHVSCIDMWLYSHTNCPLCRTDTTLPPQLLQPLPDSGGSVPVHDFNMLPDFGRHSQII